MSISAKDFLADAGAAFSLILIAASLLGGLPALAADVSAASTVTSGGLTLHSAAVKLPDDARVFPGGDKADVVNANCLTCHSAGMVLTQPKLSRSAWQGEVEKMSKAYKAPVAETDVSAIVDYLVGLNAGKQSAPE